MYFDALKHGDTEQALIIEFLTPDRPAPPKCSEYTLAVTGPVTTHRARSNRPLPHRLAKPNRVMAKPRIDIALTHAFVVDVSFRRTFPRATPGLPLFVAGLGKMF